MQVPRERPWAHHPARHYGLEASGVMTKAKTIKKMRQKGWIFSTPYSYDRRKINRFLNKEMEKEGLDKWKEGDYTSLINGR